MATARDWAGVEDAGACGDGDTARAHGEEERHR